MRRSGYVTTGRRTVVINSAHEEGWFLYGHAIYMGMVVLFLALFLLSVCTDGTM